MRSSRTVWRALTLGFVLGVALSACSGGAGDRATNAATPASISPIRTTPQPNGGPLPGLIVFHDRQGFWIVLGTLSVLRSNALGTGSSILSALAGTAVGIFVGAALVLSLIHI